MNFIGETYSVGLARYGEKFAHDFFPRLEVAMPNLFSKLMFHQSQEQPDDFYALYDAQNDSFVVQLDPELEHIIIWDGTGHVELCAAYADPPAMAIEYIQEEILQSIDL